MITVSFKSIIVSSVAFNLNLYFVTFVFTKSF